MPSTPLEETLRNLPQIGTIIKDRQYRQVWRFEHDGEAYFLKFYPKGGPRDLFRRFFRGSPAVSEFTRLQWLQNAAVPAPRAIAVMVGFRINQTVGDAVILQAIEPSVSLDQILIDAELRGERVPNHLQLASQVCSIVQQLGRAKLGHEDLHLGNFLLHEGKLFLLDAYAVQAGGLKMRDLMMLAHSTRRFCTRTDLMRAWNQFAPGTFPPEKNKVSQLLWKRFLQSTVRENRYFGRLKNSGWSGIFYRQTKHGYRWSNASQLDISTSDWEAQWPLLLGKLESDQLPVIKRSRSGDVMSDPDCAGGKID